MSYGTPVKRLIAKLSKNPDVSFVYVGYNINSGCVTYQKRKHDTNATEVLDAAEYIFIYQDEVIS